MAYFAYFQTYASSYDFYMLISNDQIIQVSTSSWQTWNLSKKLHRRILRLKILHRQFHLISTVLVGKKTQKNEWKWRNLLRWQKFYTAAGTDGMDKFHLWFLSELVTDMGHMIRLCSDKKVVIFFFMTHHSTITRCDWMGLTKYYYTSIRNNMSLLRIVLQYQETNLIFCCSHLGISQWVL